MHLNVMYTYICLPRSVWACNQNRIITLTANGCEALEIHSRTEDNVLFPGSLGNYSI